MKIAHKTILTVLLNIILYILTSSTICIASEVSEQASEILKFDARKVSQEFMGRIFAHPTHPESSKVPFGMSRDHFGHLQKHYMELKEYFPQIDDLDPIDMMAFFVTEVLKKEAHEGGNFVSSLEIQISSNKQEMATLTIQIPIKIRENDIVYLIFIAKQAVEDYRNGGGFKIISFFPSKQQKLVPMKNQLSSCNALPQYSHRAHNGPHWIKSLLFYDDQEQQESDIDIEPEIKDNSSQQIDDIKSKDEESNKVIATETKQYLQYYQERQHNGSIIKNAYMLKDKICGYAEVTYSNGSIYAGYHNSGKKDGYGRLCYTYSDTTYQYDGLWQDGLQNGDGEETIRSKNVQYTCKGVWKHGVLNGHAIMTVINLTDNKTILTFDGRVDGSNAEGTLINHNAGSKENGTFLIVNGTPRLINGTLESETGAIMEIKPYLDNSNLIKATTTFKNGVICRRVGSINSKDFSIDYNGHYELSGFSDGTQYKGTFKEWGNSQDNVISFCAGLKFNPLANGYDIMENNKLFSSIHRNFETLDNVPAKIVLRSPKQQVQFDKCIWSARNGAMVVFALDRDIPMIEKMIKDYNNYPIKITAEPKANYAPYNYITKYAHCYIYDNTTYDITINDTENAQIVSYIMAEVSDYNELHGTKTPIFIVSQKQKLKMTNTQFSIKSQSETQGTIQSNAKGQNSPAYIRKHQARIVKSFSEIQGLIAENDLSGAQNALADMHQKIQSHKTMLISKQYSNLQEAKELLNAQLLTSSVCCVLEEIIAKRLQGREFSVKGKLGLKNDNNLILNTAQLCIDAEQQQICNILQENSNAALLLTGQYLAQICTLKEGKLQEQTKDTIQSQLFE